MIYSRQIRLEGQEADNFLEASGITICDDEIIIEDTVVEFDAAIEHLAENGISLYEDCIILEGKQAEEYKARKAKEREDKDKAELERYKRRYGSGHVAGTNPNEIDYMDPIRVMDSNRMYSKEVNRRMKNAGSEIINAREKIKNNEFTDNDKTRLMNAAKNLQNAAKQSGTKFHLSTNAIKMVKEPTKAGLNKATDPINRHMRRHPKQYSESTIFDSVELTGIDEQVFFKYKKDSQGLLHAEAKKLAGIVNGIDLSDDSHLSKYGIHIDKIEYADDSFILRRKFNVKIHFGYDYKIKSEDIDYEVVEKLMDAILAKAGYRKYGRYSVKKGNGYLFAIDYQDIYIEESDQYYTVNYGTGDMPMTSGMTSRAHTPEQRYIDIDIKCIEDTPGNMSLLRK